MFAFPLIYSIFQLALVLVALGGESLTTNKCTLWCQAPAEFKHQMSESFSIPGAWWDVLMMQIFCTSPGYTAYRKVCGRPSADLDCESIEESKEKYCGTENGGFRLDENGNAGGKGKNMGHITELWDNWTVTTKNLDRQRGYSWTSRHWWLPMHFNRRHTLPSAGRVCALQVPSYSLPCGGVQFVPYEADRPPIFIVLRYKGPSSFNLLSYYILYYYIYE